MHIALASIIIIDRVGLMGAKFKALNRGSRLGPGSRFFNTAELSENRFDQTRTPVLHRIFEHRREFAAIMCALGFYTLAARQLNPIEIGMADIKRGKRLRTRIGRPHPHKLDIEDCV